MFSIKNLKSTICTTLLALATTAAHASGTPGLGSWLIGWFDWLPF